MTTKRKLIWLAAALIGLPMALFPLTWGLHIPLPGMAKAESTDDVLDLTISATPTPTPANADNPLGDPRGYLARFFFVKDGFFYAGIPNLVGINGREVIWPMQFKIDQLRTEEVAVSEADRLNGITTVYVIHGKAIYRGAYYGDGPTPLWTDWKDDADMHITFMTVKGKLDIRRDGGDSWRSMLYTPSVEILRTWGVVPAQ